MQVADDETQFQVLEDFKNLQANFESESIVLLKKKMNNHESQYKIHFVKVTFVMVYDATAVINSQQQSELANWEIMPITDNSFTWHFYSTNKEESDNNEHKYESISETSLVNLFGGPQVFQWKAESLTKFQMRKKANFDDPDDDTQDPLFAKNSSNRGESQCLNSFYYNVEDKNVFLEVDDTALYSYSYDSTINVFYGRPKNSMKDADKVEVSAEWLRENLGDEFVEHVKNSTDYSKVKYVEVFPGNPMEYNPSIVVSQSDPCIQYQQKTKEHAHFHPLQVYYII